MNDAATQEEVEDAGLADLLIGQYVLPFEAVSVLLLAALIGALALVRPQAGHGGSRPGVSGSDRGLAGYVPSKPS